VHIVGGKKNETRLKAIVRVMPGLQEIEAEATEMAQHLAMERWDEEVTLWNFHILKQSRLLDSGSGFGPHADERDDGPKHLRGNLLLSVAVKLTADPAGSEGTWMQVVGHGPVRYGEAAGSVRIFESARQHQSLFTPTNAGTIRKIVFFYTRSDDTI